MPDQEMLYAIDDHVATLTFNRPEVMNAFGDDTRAALAACMKRAEDDPRVRCIIVTGAGKAFAAGGDVKGMAALQEQNDSDVVRARMRVGGEIVQTLRTMRTPVIAAVNGPAAGAGMNLALACDIRYAAESAVFAESFVRIGLVPDWGGHYLLTRIVGTGQAMELMMLGERIDAHTALRLGIVNAVFPSASFMDEVRDRARAIASRPPGAIAAIKRGVHTGARGTLEETLAFEESVQAELFLSDDAREGISAFLEKREPRFRGR